MNTPNDGLILAITNHPCLRSKSLEESRRIAEIIVQGGFLVFILSNRGIEQFTYHRNTGLPKRAFYFVHRIISRNPPNTSIFGQFLSTIETHPDEIYPKHARHLDIIVFPLDAPLDNRVLSIELLTPEDTLDVEHRLRAIIDNYQRVIGGLIGKLHGD